MKQLIRLTILFCTCAAMMTAFAGTETYSGKEMKQVAPAPPPECNWSGFYVGLHVGGQFGHSEDFDFGYNAIDHPFGYSESGVIAGGQAGYNFQWNWLVLGAEVDLGYMNLDGRTVDPASVRFDNSDTHASTDSDFYTTFRARIGVALNHGLIYATGGAIGTNYTTRFHIDAIDFDARRSDFDWGYAVGGGIERQILNRHWSVKVEYLYFSLDDQSFQNTRTFLIADEFRAFTGRFTGESFGHIVRAGLNYHF